jgi:beta-glucosidase
MRPYLLRSLPALVLLAAIASGCGIRLERISEREARASASASASTGGVAVQRRAPGAVSLGDLSAFQQTTRLGETGWIPGPGYTVSDAGAFVQVEADGVGPAYQSVVYALGEPQDFSRMQVLHVRVRVPEGGRYPTFRADLIDADGRGTNAAPVEVTPTGVGTVADLVFDFAGKFQQVTPEAAPVDASRIAAVALFANYDGPAYTGTFLVDRMARSRTMTVPDRVGTEDDLVLAADATGARLLYGFEGDEGLTSGSTELGSPGLGMGQNLSASPQGGALVIESAGAGANYENVALFAETFSLEASPIVHVRARLLEGSPPVEFRIDFLDMDGYGTSAEPAVVTIESGEYQDYVLDYRGKFDSVYPDPRPVKADQIGGLVMFLNAGQPTTGGVAIDRIAVSTSEEIPGDLEGGGAAGAMPSAPASPSAGPGAGTGDGADGAVLITDFSQPLTEGVGLGTPGLNPSGLGVEQPGDVLRLTGSSVAPNYANAGIYFPVADMGQTPFLHVRMRTTGGPADVRVDLVQTDGYGTNANPTIKTVQTGAFRDYVYDFTGKFQSVYPDNRAVAPTQIGGAVVFINFDGEPFTGALEIDRVVRSSSAAVPGDDIGAAAPTGGAPDGVAPIQSALGAGAAGAVNPGPSTDEMRPDPERLLALQAVGLGPVTGDVHSGDYLARARRPALSETPAVRRFVDDLLARMTLEEKVGQMTQITLDVIVDKSSRPFLPDPEKLREAVGTWGIGSILNTVDEAYTAAEWQRITGMIETAAAETRLGIPVLYGLDSVHGANYVADAAIMPQNLGMAATFNPALVESAAAVTARDTRAAGVAWNFAPVLDLGRQPAWARMYETFGEDPYLASALGVAQIRGFEGERLADPTSVAATAKHFLGYSNPRTGRDRTTTVISDRDLYDLYVPPFRAAIDAGVATVMVNSGDVNGIPAHASRELLIDLLRDELGFEGVVVSDWEDVKKLAAIHRVAEDEREATRMAVLAGVDMSMVPNDYSFARILAELVRDGEVPEARIDEAARRILTLKAELGMFDDPDPAAGLVAEVGDAASQAVALQAARESITLLRNGGAGGPALPLPDGARVLVTGPAANSFRALNNGWTYTWQGDARAERFYPSDRPTVLGGIRAYAEAGGGSVEYVLGSEFEAAIPGGAAAAAAAARQSDVAVVVLGESSYAELVGSIGSLGMPAPQLALLDAVAATGTPVVLVLVEGRPRVLGAHADQADAIVLAYNPGNEGGQAVADVLYGRVNPSGRLPFTYPSESNNIVAYDRTRADDQDTAFGFNAFRPLARFGDGLSYTTFETRGLAAPARVPVATLSEGVPVAVTVENTGSVAGHEVVMLYVSDLVASAQPPTERLARFAKVHLAPGEARTVRFALDELALSTIGRDASRRVEPGRYTLRVGDQTARLDVTGDAPVILSARQPERLQKSAN